MTRPYTIEFERSHWQWTVCDTADPDAELGYFYKKVDAKRVANMLNERVELLTQKTPTTTEKE
jgi:hypothetical protein